MSGQDKCCKYVIEKKVIFDSSERSLLAIDSGEKLTIYVTSSECLLFLIQHQGQIITQRELMTRIWDDHGREVTANTFYQMILSLRRALAKCGIDDVIVTVKRKGLYIPASIKIEPEDGFVDYQSSPTATLLPPAKNKPRTQINYRGLATKINISLIGLISSCIAGAVFLLNQYHHDDNYLIKHTTTLHFNECTVFTQVNKYTMQTVGVYLNNKNIDCSESKYVYLTSLTDTPQESIIICKHPLTLNNENSCSSIFYLDGNHG